MRHAALAVIRASDAAAQVATDLAVMHAALIEKRVQLHFFISNDLVDDRACAPAADDAGASRLAPAPGRSQVVGRAGAIDG